MNAFSGARGLIRPGVMMEGGFDCFAVLRLSVGTRPESIWRHPDGLEHVAFTWVHAPRFTSLFCEQIHPFR
jgi:hypothetical protein